MGRPDSKNSSRASAGGGATQPATASAMLVGARATHLMRSAMRARLRGVVPICAVRCSSVITGGGGASGSGGTGKPFACPRCAVPLTKFWQQDQPLWGCVDCREIYSQRDSSGAASRLPRSWSASRASTPAETSAAAPESAGATDGVRFSLGQLPPPATIKAELDKYVIGQDDVKRALSVAMYNHYKRVRIGGSSELPMPAAWAGNSAGGPIDDSPDLAATCSQGEGHEHTAACGGGGSAPGLPPPSGADSGSSLVGLEREAGESIEMEKSNIMLVGPTGSGKTLLARTLARLVDVPFTIADATSLTQAGCVRGGGACVEGLHHRTKSHAGRACVCPCVCLWERRMRGAPPLQLTSSDPPACSPTRYVGEDVESILHKLYAASGQNVEATQVGARATKGEGRNRPRGLGSTTGSTLAPTLAPPPSTLGGQIPHKPAREGASRPSSSGCFRHAARGNRDGRARALSPTPRAPPAHTCPPLPFGGFTLSPAHPSRLFELASLTRPFRSCRCSSASSTWMRSTSWRARPTPSRRRATSRARESSRRDTPPHGTRITRLNTVSARGTMPCTRIKYWQGAALPGISTRPWARSAWGSGHQRASQRSPAFERTKDLEQSCRHGAVLEPARPCAETRHRARRSAAQERRSF